MSCTSRNANSETPLLTNEEICASALLCFASCTFSNRLENVCSGQGQRHETDKREHSLCMTTFEALATRTLRTRPICLESVVVANLIGRNIGPPMGASLTLRRLVTVPSSQTAHGEPPPTQAQTG